MIFGEGVEGFIKHHRRSAGADLDFVVVGVVVKREAWSFTLNWKAHVSVRDDVPVILAEFEPIAAFDGVRILDQEAEGRQILESRLKELAVTLAGD